MLGSGLDPRIGFFHVDNGRRDSLVYDLMEPYRALVIDRFVLRVLNYGTLTPKHFLVASDGCLLTDECRSIWCTAYETFIEKPTKICGARSPRSMICEDIGAFARKIFSTSCHEIA